MKYQVKEVKDREQLIEELEVAWKAIRSVEEAIDELRTRTRNLRESYALSESEADSVNRAVLASQFLETLRSTRVVDEALQPYRDYYNDKEEGDI